MAWCCVVDVAVLFFFGFGDGVLFFFGMNIDEHFDLVSTQNLKSQFEFVYCAPWAKPVYIAVARMSTDDASLSR